MIKDKNAKKVIELLMMTQVNIEEVASRLALVAPDLFVALVETPSTDLDNLEVSITFKDERAHAYYARIGAEIELGNKVNAIKLTRELTGWGLKEAKDNCDMVEIAITRSPDRYRPINRYINFGVDYEPNHDAAFVNGVLDVLRYKEAI